MVFGKESEEERTKKTTATEIEMCAWKENKNNKTDNYEKR